MEFNLQTILGNLEHLNEEIERQRKYYSGDPFWTAVATYYIEQYKDVKGFEKELRELFKKQRQENANPHAFAIVVLLERKILGVDNQVSRQER